MPKPPDKTVPLPRGLLVRMPDGSPSHDGYALRQEIVTWCEDMLGAGWEVASRRGDRIEAKGARESEPDHGDTPSLVIVFDTHGDMMAFMLRWL